MSEKAFAPFAEYIIIFMERMMKRTIREVKKRENAVIRINRIDIAGQNYIEIRQYYRSNDGDFVASTKGLTFQCSLSDEILDGLKDAAAECPPQD